MIYDRVAKSYLTKHKQSEMFENARDFASRKCVCYIYKVIHMYITLASANIVDFQS